MKKIKNLWGEGGGGKEGNGTGTNDNICDQPHPSVPVDTLQSSIVLPNGLGMDNGQ